MPDDSQTKARIRLFGGFEVTGPDGASIAISSRKNKALLAILALSPGFKASRDRLIALLWSDRGDKQARNSLRQALVALRREFGDDCHTILFTDGDQVGLRTDSVSVDAVEFERMAESGDLADAASLYRGRLLEELLVRDEAFEEWAERERWRLIERAINVHEKLEKAAAPGKRVELARQLVALDPVREASHRLLMEALAAAGERDQALRQYEILRDTLARELDTVPSAESNLLRSQLISGENAIAAIPSAADGDLAHGRDVPSIAVLPFSNLSGDPEQTYFADGISTDIINELGRFGELLVTGASSSFSFRDQNLDGKEIAERLNVAYLVEGTVRRAGSRVRITAQLIEANTGTRVWGEHYDRELSDIFELQDEIAGNVAMAVIGGVRRQGAHRARRKPTDQFAAYDYVLRAMELMSRRYPGFLEARALLEESVKLDPAYAQAHSLLSSCLLVQAFFDVDLVSVDLALTTARRAVALEPHDALPNSAVGHALIFAGHLDDAQGHLDKAIEINPNDAWIRLLRALCHLYRGNCDLAMADIDGAFRRAPIPPDWFWDVRGMVLSAAGKYEQALASYSRSAEVPPWGYCYKAICYSHLGDDDRARDAIAKAKEAIPSNSVSAFFAFEPYEDVEIVARFESALIKSGLPA